MKLIILIAVSVCLSAQTLTLSGPASAKPGATVNVTLNAMGTGTAALQWTVGYPAGYTATVTAGAAAATKSLTCSASNAFCLLVGNNATVIGTGTLATYALKIPLTAAAGPATVSLSGLLGASPTGNPVVISAGPVYTFTIQIKEDLNGDGTVTAADVTLMTNQVIAAQSNPAACVNDQNADGKCDVLDAFLVLLKSLGIIVL